MNNVAGKVQVDFRSEEPLYLQIARQIEELVGIGELNVGDQLPTVREMAAELSINFNTVARVYRTLDQEGIISTRQGRGSYVLEDDAHSLNATPLTHEEQIIRLVGEFVEKAQRLQISTGELRIALTRKEKREGKRKAANLRKKIRGGQKKRVVMPAWAREVRNARISPVLPSIGRKLKSRST